MTPRRLAVIGAVVVALAAYLLWPAPALSDEEQIRALVSDAIAAAGKRDAAGVTEALADDFTGQGLSRQEVQQLVLGQIMRGGGPITVVNTGLTVSVTSPTQATFEGTFVLTRVGLGQGDGMSRYRIDAVLAKRQARWKIVSATWLPE